MERQIYLIVTRSHWPERNGGIANPVVEDFIAERNACAWRRPSSSATAR